MIIDFYHNSKESLDPWRVVIASLFELSSDEVIEIINLSGLKVDWSLNKQESYSHSTRKRAYQPRVIESYEKLDDTDKLKVCHITANELIKCNEEIHVNLKKHLNNIGWDINENGLSTTNVDIMEMFFPQGKEHDAYVKIRDILNTANHEVSVIDPYMDSTIFTVLGNVAEKKLKIRFLTHNISNDFELEKEKFCNQYKSVDIELRKGKAFHDRFIIIDESSCYHIGASIKDAGKKAFMISRIEDEFNARALLIQLENSWKN